MLRPTQTAGAEKPATTSAVFSMFGGGAKKEKKDEDEDRGDVSGSAKAQREAAAAAEKETKEEVRTRRFCSCVLDRELRC